MGVKNIFLTGVSENIGQIKLINLHFTLLFQ